MSEKYQNKYRIPSARLQNWDYGANGAYFITICTENRVKYFGKIENCQMQLNQLGQLAEQFFSLIPNYFPFVELGNFVVMPNHVHGIFIIDKNANVLLNGCDGGVVGTRLIVETRLIASLPSPTEPPSTMGPSPTEPSPMDTPTETPSPTGKPGGKPGGFAGNKNPMLHDNISRIIRWYKGRRSFEMHKTHADLKASVSLFAKDGMVWMNQNQLAELFATSIPVGLTA
jgi:putative transposase